jgi:putative membrane protein
MSNSQKHTTTDSKYIQQHLANERTYLAWIRTSITIIGVGFLITNLHFSTLNEHQIIGDLLAETIGLASIFVGIATLLMSTFGYFKKGKGINNQNFGYSKILIVFLSLFMFLIFLVFGTYYLFAWGLI